MSGKSPPRLALMIYNIASHSSFLLEQEGLDKWYGTSSPRLSLGMMAVKGK